MFKFLPITRPEQWEAIEEIQGASYLPSLQEDISALQFKNDIENSVCRLIQAPLGQALSSERDQAVGYILAHPFPLDGVPDLNASNRAMRSTGVKQNEQNIFLHDFCLSKKVQGKGLGKRVIMNFMRLLTQLGFSSVSLVAVQGSRNFWASFGFEQGSVSKCMNSYGNDAVFMYKELQ